MADWEPPVFVDVVDYKRVIRVVRQADVDRWIEIERQYNALVLAIRQNLPAEETDGNG